MEDENENNEEIDGAIMRGIFNFDIFFLMIITFF